MVCPICIFVDAARAGEDGRPGIGLVAEWAALPDSAGVLAHIAQDEPISYSRDDLRGFAADGRRGGGRDSGPDRVGATRRPERAPRARRRY